MATTTMMPTTTGQAMPTESGRGASNHNMDDNGGGRPLLFFVALGFGVVFTNLWIIVGVKYCFRYNARARRGQVDAETGEPIDLPNMQRPRRRREKKLMSMDEVNDRFPLTKYKVWRATREQEGLPAAGGVTAPPSRAASIKEIMLDRTSTENDTSTFAEVPLHTSPPEGTAAGRQSTDRRDFAATTTTSDPEKRPQSSHQPINTNSTNTTDNTPSNQPRSSTDPDPADDDDPITTALPTSTANELLQNPGDACAICIDTLEDDDEIRGLTCGHAFHAGCLDPWLTSRRACCPLCKADYYIPKPRPLNQADAEAENAAQGFEPGQRRRRRTFMGPDAEDGLSAPAPAWLGGRPGFPMGVGLRPYFSTSRFNASHNSANSFAQRAQARANSRSDAVHAETVGSSNPPETFDENAPEVQQQPTQGRFSAFASRFRRNSAALSPNPVAAVHNAEQEQQQATPGQLEAGTSNQGRRNRPWGSFRA